MPISLSPAKTIRRSPSLNSAILPTNCSAMLASLPGLFVCAVWTFCAVWTLGAIVNVLFGGTLRPILAAVKAAPTVTCILQLLESNQRQALVRHPLITCQIGRAHV